MWTRAEYDRLIEVGVFAPGDPVELLGGELIVSEPQGSRHYTALRLVEDGEHPSRPVLVVEVAESSLRLDREHKGNLYARARLEDYWIVNLVEGALEIYRAPVADPSATYGWRYATRIVLGPEASATPLAAPTVSMAVRTLLP